MERQGPGQPEVSVLERRGGLMPRDKRHISECPRLFCHQTQVHLDHQYEHDRDGPRGAKALPRRRRAARSGPSVCDRIFAAEHDDASHYLAVETCSRS